MVDTLGMRTVQLNGRLVAGILDGPDPGTEPDAPALVGYVVRLTPVADEKYPGVAELHMSDPPTTMFISKFEVVTNADGVIENPDTGETVIRIPADYPGPAGVRRRVRWKSEIRTPTGATLITKEWVVPLDATAVDLTTIEPLPGTVVINLDAWEELVLTVREAGGLAVASAQAAASSEATVVAAASEVRAHAELFVAPAKGVLDTIMGGDIAGIVPVVAGKVAKGDIVVAAKDYGAKGDGTTDDTAALNSALTAMQTRGGGVLLLDGTYILSGTGILSRAGTVHIIGRPGTVIRPSVFGVTGPLIQTSASFLRKSLTIDGVTFDLDGRASAGVSVNGDHVVGGVTVRNCHFRNFAATSTGIMLANATGVLVEDCTFRTQGAPAGTGILAYRGGRDITIRDCEFWYLRDMVTVAGGSVPTAAPQVRDVTVDGCLFENGWWLIKARMSGVGTYTATSLTEAGKTFTGQGIAVLDTVRAMVLRSSGVTGAGSGQQTQLIDAAAGFVAAGVKPGHIIRTPGKWAVALSVEPGKLWHEGWQDSTTYEPTYPPTVGAAYTVHEPILGRVTAIAAGEITIQHWHTLDGTVTTPENGTPYEVMVTKSNYPLHVEYAVYGVIVSNNTFRRGWSDQCSIYANGGVISDNLITDGQDMGITLQGSNMSVHGNTVRHQGAGCIWAQERGHTVHDNELFDAPWQNMTEAVAPLVFWNATLCKGHDNVIHSTGATAAARSKYAVVVRGESPLVELNDNIIVGAFAVAQYYYTGATTSVRGRFGPGATFLRPGGGTLRGTFRGNGAPTITADVGSTYFREDGGAGATLYLKETPWTSSVWRAI